MMKPTYHYLYIPGLGDAKVTWQQRAVKTWTIWGVEGELIQMNWADKQPWQPKLQKILDRIDQLASENKPVVLVGASAGASAVINAFAARKDKVAGCILIAAKVNRPDSVGQNYRSENPAFVTSINDCQASLASLTTEDRQRILSVYGLVDETVYKADSRVPGAKNRVVFSFGHAITIATQLLFGIPSYKRFIAYIGKAS